MNNKIIIVEDEAVVALDFKMMLREIGYTDISFFTRGSETLEYLKNEKPLLAILDIRLADDISGLEIAQKLKEKNVPFIFLSAFSDKKNYENALKLNPIDILSKPVSTNDLINSINKIKK